jgi:Tol biopolymer transport system component
VAFSAKDPADNMVRLFVAKTDGTNIKKVADHESYSLEFTAAGKLRYSYYVVSKTKYFEYDLAAATSAEITAPKIDRVGGTLSPDKKLRAYVSTRDGKTNLFVSDADGKNEVQLTDLHFVQQGDILWSTDSSFVMFNLVMPGESARFLVSVNGIASARKIVDINTNAWYGY